MAIRGMMWGREDAWLDDAGRLAAVVTRDAEFDHFEAVREGLVQLLPALASRAGADGMAWLAEAGRAELLVARAASDTRPVCAAPVPGAGLRPQPWRGSLSRPGGHDEVAG